MARTKALELPSAAASRLNSALGYGMNRTLRWIPAIYAKVFFEDRIRSLFLDGDNRT